MNRKEIMGDKLALFESAGISTHGFDYAIPQSMVEQLRMMGIEDVPAHFVTDCSGPCAFPKLRPISEPLFQILQHRSKANEEVWGALFVASCESDASVGDKAIFDILKDNQAALDEADAGLLDLNIVVSLVNEAFLRGMESSEAFARGRKSMKAELDAIDRSMAPAPDPKDSGFDVYG